MKNYVITNPEGTKFLCIDTQNPKYAGIGYIVDKLSTECLTTRTNALWLMSDDMYFEKSHFVDDTNVEALQEFFLTAVVKRIDELPGQKADQKALRSFVELPLNDDKTYLYVRPAQVASVRGTKYGDHSYLIVIGDPKSYHVGLPVTEVVNILEKADVKQTTMDVATFAH
jgi:hypothetical protein